MVGGMVGGGVTLGEARPRRLVKPDASRMVTRDSSQGDQTGSRRFGRRDGEGEESPVGMIGRLDSVWYRRGRETRGNVTA